MSHEAITKLSSLEIQAPIGEANYGFYVPHMTQTEINSIPADLIEDGGIVFNSTTSKFNFREGSTWLALPGGGVSPADATYITQTSNPLLTNEQALASLSPGGILQSDLNGILNIATQIIDTYSATPGTTNNLFIGKNAGNLTATGTYNIGTGSYTLTALTNGANNLAFGSFSLIALTSGSNNSAFGKNSLYALTSGSNNSAFGSGALGNLNIGIFTTGSDNSAFGYNALSTLTTGSSNSAFGYNALNLLSANNGDYNTAIGLNAGASYTYYNKCTFLGANTDASASGFTNATAIGVNAIAGASNTLILGQTGGNAPNVGIGTSTPLAPLHVVGTSRQTPIINNLTDPGPQNDWITVQFANQVSNNTPVLIGSIPFSSSSKVIYFQVKWMAYDTISNEMAIWNNYYSFTYSGGRQIGPSNGIIRSSGFTTTPFTISGDANYINFYGIANGSNLTNHLLTVESFSL